MRLISGSAAVLQQHSRADGAIARVLLVRTAGGVRAERRRRISTSIRVHCSSARACTRVVYDYSRTLRALPVRIVVRVYTTLRRCSY